MIGSDWLRNASAENAAGADEAGPGAKNIPKHGQMYPLTDRTHRVALGGSVKVEYTFNGQPVTAMAPVKVQKVVKLHVNILKNAGNAVITDADAMKDIAAMRESYARLGIRVDLDGNTLFKVDPPAGVGLGDGLDDKETIFFPRFKAVNNGDGLVMELQLTAEERALFDDKNLWAKTAANPLEKDMSFIHVYYVNKTTEGARGYSVSSAVGLIPLVRASLDVSSHS